MRVHINKAVSLTALPGSEVEVSEEQYRYIWKFCTPVSAEEKPKRKRVVKKKTETNEA